MAVRARSATPLAKALSQVADETDVTVRADGAAIALEIALSRLDPPLRPRIPTKPSRATSFVLQGESADLPLRYDVKELGKSIAQRLDLLEAYVVAGAAGLTAGELVAMRKVLGRPVRTRDGIEVRRDADVVLDDAAVERAALAVTDLIFRMWAADGFRPLDAWDR